MGEIRVVLIFNEDNERCKTALITELVYAWLHKENAPVSSYNNANVSVEELKQQLLQDTDFIQQIKKSVVIEEDAGKLIHEDGYTYVDYNRGGVPLIEIVSMADIETPEEAKEYAEKLQLIMRNVGVSDCKMQEGSMRCDVNVSIHEPGEPWGTRTEIKNINSLSNIVRAMELEMERQEDIIESGEKVIQSTMR